MKVIREGAIIFGITLAGEFLNVVLPLPIPTGVYGLFLMLVLLCTGLLKLEQVETVGGFLLDIMPILFVPATVGLLESYVELKPILLPLVVISVVSMLVVMVVTGKVAELIMGKTGRKDGEQ